MIRHLRRAHVGLGYLVAAGVIAVAILLGLVSQALPWLARNPARVDAWLEHRIGRPVSFEGMRTHWTRRGPVVELKQLRIGEGADAFLVGDAQLLASIYSGLLPGHAFSELRLRGLELVLVRGDDGTWQVRGLPGQAHDGSDPFAALEKLGELHVVGGRLQVLAPAYHLDATVPRVDVRLRVDGPRVRAGLRAWPASGRLPVDGVLDFDRTTGNGRAYAGAKTLDLRDWAPFLHAAGVRVEGGHGSAAAWAEVRGKRVPSIVTEAGLRGVTLAGAPLDDATPRLAFESVDVLGRFRAADGQWQVDLPRLRLAQAGSQQTLDGLAVAGGRRFVLAAERVDAAPLLQALAMTDRIAPGTRRWLRAARPVGMVEQVRVDGRAPQLRVAARVVSFGFDRVGGSPGLRGIGGRLQGDADGLSFEFDPASPVGFSWPEAFGPDHVVRLTGRAGAWREGEGWRVGTQALHVAGDGYGADVRGGLWWQGDGTLPWIDLAADIDAARVPVAKRFWVRHLMPPEVVHWLDTALVGGTVRSGRAVVTGDLDDWPFDRREGRFEARAHITGATLKFQPDWPAAEQVDAEVAFIANGFSIDGSGRVGKVALSSLRAGIDDYSLGALTVQARARTDAGALLDVVKASPLHAMQPETIDALAASGPAQLRFGMELPLGRPDPLAITGQVELQGARLADRRWNLRFDQVAGVARYDAEGFTANGLSVRHEGQAGRLSLRAGAGHVREAGNVFEGAIDASFDIDDLLARAPEMDWLGPYVAGRSPWSVGVVVPAGSGVPARLQLRSSLVGTALDLPAPLHKPAAQALAASVDTPLPLGSGDITVGLGNLLAVRARSAQGRTGVRVALGSGRVDEAPPAQGLVATGRAARLDALDWIAFARGGSGGSDGLTLQRIDVEADRLMLLGGQFPDARLQVQPVAGGALTVRVDGPALAGGVTVPAGDGPVAGRFGRVFWRAPPPATGSATGGEGTAVARVGEVDPSGVPPLAIDVDDLRFGDARLGNARLRTRPTAGGLRLEQFTARGHDQQLEASGEWTGRGQSSRTRLQATVTSRDFGQLLDGFGFGGRLGGGHGSARLEAAWPGAPSDLRPGNLRGSLTIDARDGQLLEVEPGAGRVLGLLSLAELPRRLTLDFSDFFAKGFGFNRMHGTVAFQDGLARSDDLAIRAPAADIDIRGAANLRQQTFDQTIEVRPKSGNLLTAVGALTGGPLGAVIGAAANAVLKKPLGQIGARTYRVTGPWADPTVEVITREQTRVQVATRPAG